jgi:PhzF family phenazine biosynthesis protein
MKIRMFQIDAFARRVFSGNPAAVCPLASWLPDATMQAIAAENNLSETAFFVPCEGEFDIRWFTPVQEVELCGHATLASGFVVLHVLEPARDKVRFASRSGPLTVRRDGDRLALSLPRQTPTPVTPPPALATALGRAPTEVYGYGSKYLCVYDDAADVAALRPDFAALTRLDRYGVIATAPGNAGDCDFVSRFFAPGAGVPEDPVTGSAHSLLVPYWAARLGRDALFARQISKRGGELWCSLDERSVTLSGYATLYFAGDAEV